MLVASGAAVGQWDTAAGNGTWVLGAAPGWDAGLYNVANASVSFAVGSGESFAVFASDYYDTKFVAGTTLRLTVTFTDDTVATATAVVPVVPTVTGIAPGSGVQGTAVPVTVSGTNFQSGATLSVGAGVTVTGVTVPSATQLLATLTLAVDAVVGPRDVTVTNPGGSGRDTGGRVRGDRAGGAAAAPAAAGGGAGVEREDPGQGGAGRDGADRGRDGGRDADGDAHGAGADGEAAGAGGERRGVGQWDTAAGNGTWVLGAAPGWDAGLYNVANASVSFAVGSGESFAVFASDYYDTKFVAGTTLMTVTFTDDTVATATAVVPVVPTVTGIAPGSGVQGTAVPVTVSGTNFQSGATLSVGAGVTVTGVTVPSATQLLATLTLAVDAVVGPRDVTVTNPGGSGVTLVGGFAVTAPGAPPPPPPGVALAWNGKIRDKVGQGETALTADGTADGTLTATLTGPGRTVKQLVLVASGAASGQWDTAAGNGTWVLGAAPGGTRACTTSRTPR